MNKLFMATTKISTDKTISQIQASLAKYGASSVLVDYLDGHVEALSFRLSINKRQIPFRLPCRWRAVQNLLGEISKRGVVDIEETEARARRVAWRQIYRWVEAQCALIETNMVKIEEVFLPYAMDSKGQTFFDRMASGNLLEYKSEASK